MNVSLPYVGVSGVETFAEAQKIREFFLKNNFSSSGKVQGAIGLCLTADILIRKQTPPSRYVPPQLLNFFYELPQDFGFIAIHYTPDLSEPFEGQVKMIVESIDELRSNLVIQINNFIPDSSILKKLKTIYPFIEFILQISRPEELTGFSSYIFSALLDESRGMGCQVNIHQTAAFITDIHSMYPDIGIGFAGGVKPESVLKTLDSLAGKLDGSLGISIDSESGLRDAEDRLSLKKVQQYIAEASKFYL